MTTPDCCCDECFFWSIHPFPATIAELKERFGFLYTDTPATEEYDYPTPWYIDGNGYLRIDGANATSEFRFRVDAHDHRVTDTTPAPEGAGRAMLRTRTRITFEAEADSELLLAIDEGVFISVDFGTQRVGLKQISASGTQTAHPLFTEYFRRFLTMRLELAALYTRFLRINSRTIDQARTLTPGENVLEIRRGQNTAETDPEIFALHSVYLNDEEIYSFQSRQSIIRIRSGDGSSVSRDNQEDQNITGQSTTGGGALTIKDIATYWGGYTGLQQQLRPNFGEGRDDTVVNRPVCETFRHTWPTGTNLRLTITNGVSLLGNVTLDQANPYPSAFWESDENSSDFIPQLFATLYPYHHLITNGYYGDLYLSVPGVQFQPVAYTIYGDYPRQASGDPAGVFNAVVNATDLRTDIYPGDAGTHYWFDYIIDWTWSDGQISLNLNLAVRVVTLSGGSNSLTAYETSYFYPVSWYKDWRYAPDNLDVSKVQMDAADLLTIHASDPRALYYLSVAGLIDGSNAPTGIVEIETIDKEVSKNQQLESTVEVATAHTYKATETYATKPNTPHHLKIDVATAGGTLKMTVEGDDGIIYYLTEGESHEIPFIPTENEYQFKYREAPDSTAIDPMSFLTTSAHQEFSSGTFGNTFTYPDDYDNTTGGGGGGGGMAPLPDWDLQTGVSIVALFPTVEKVQKPYSYSITSGSLPAGVRLDAVNGQVYGTPTAAGNTGTVRVTLTDGDGNTRFYEATWRTN